MQLARRFEDGRQVRVIEWDADSSTDLSAVVAFLIAVAICAGSVVGAALTTGWPRALLVVLAVLSGVLWIGVGGSLMVIAIVVTAVRARRITMAADALMSVTAAGLGAGLGLDTYSSGPVAIAIAPVLAVVVCALVWSRVSSGTARVRVVALAVVGVVAATAVGATAFL